MLCASATIAQPVAPTQFILPAGINPGDKMGYAVALTDQHLAITSRFDDDAGIDRGAVYLYKLNAAGTFWEFEDKLYETDTTQNGGFAWSLALTPGAGPGQGLLAIGHVADNEMGANAGAVFIHAEDSVSADPWDFQKKITQTSPGISYRFGESVAIQNSTLLVGSPGDGAIAINAGSAHIHERTQGGANAWGLVKKLVPPDPAPGQACGRSVALAGDIAVMSAIGDASLGGETGAAYVFLRNLGGASNWGFAKKLLAPDGFADQQFGNAVAVSGNIVAVGARSDTDAANRAGATYIFDRFEGAIDNFGFVKKLVPPDGAPDAFVGDVIALHNGILVTGSRSEYSAGTGAGAFYVYGQDVGGADNWGLLAKVHAPDAMPVDHFATALAIQGATIFCSVETDDTLPGMDTGSAHLFTVNSLCPQDLNGDGVVDTADLGILIGSFGESGLGDLNLDGVIDTADLGILLGGFDDTDCAYAP